MNIAILIPELAGGGAERTSQIVGNYYAEHGNKVYYFLANTRERQDYSVLGKVIRTNIETCTSNRFNSLQKMVQLIKSSFEMRRWKRKYKIDVSISFMEEFNYINILSKGREKVITSIHSMLSAYEKMYTNNWLYKKWAVSFFYPKSDILVVMSRISFDEMKDYYRVPAKKMRIVPNMITNDLTLAPEEEQWGYGTKAVICVGRLHPVKQQERIIRAFSYTCMKEPDARLIILGKGEQLEYLKSVCERCHIVDKVSFAGFTNVSYYLKHARAFVMASKVECFPNSMLEAMYFGVPVITTDSPGGCQEIVGKSNRTGRIHSITFCKYGILTPVMPGERAKISGSLVEQEIILGEAMLKVLTEDEIYKKYREQSLKRAEAYSVDRVIEKWNHIVSL